MISNKLLNYKCMQHLKFITILLFLIINFSCDNNPAFENCIEDNCGICNENPNDDCQQDCFGDWGGNSEIDCNGICGGNAVVHMMNHQIQGADFICANTGRSLSYRKLKNVFELVYTKREFWELDISGEWKITHSDGEIRLLNLSET